MPLRYKSSGVVLTFTERLECRHLTEEAMDTPLISFGLGTPDMSAVAWKLAHETIHGYAMKHGLPEIPGYYGANLDTGEVLIPA